ncbi:hypothetical protein DOTSEDRAFT_67619 [Dothistroma septosporum NZE10]|uniref:SWR1-complex protein 3 domain-containing protein n=1 Tax=Dothistroma septosporum (strain NZE10 / CBS 128990) TaxID=675120 RepID=N1PYQ9_DOTSN|nr:hypothetical protein DOTSEDRAFT_67619 [Dothistroma septosporum NZE10]
MVPIPEPRTGEKRGPGRPPKTATPAAKKQRLSATATPSYTTPMTRSPAVDSPAPEKRQPRLPAKVLDNRPLPSVSEAQASLSNDEYQSMAASAVLSASLDRSRAKWTGKGIFKKYWVKPESGKNAKPPPPDNPEMKSMKHKGECRIRLEPHIFTADVYVADQGKQPVPPKQQYAQPYRPVQQLPQDRALPPLQPGTPRPMQNGSSTPYGQSTLIPQSRAPQGRSIPSPAPPQQNSKQPQADPVISMLASRASSDAELKALMKQVATGNATQEQLRIFQRHIDELTAIISKQNQAEEDHKTKAAQSSDSIQYDEAGNSKPIMPVQDQPIQPQQPVQRQPIPSPYPQPEPSLTYQQQPSAWAPPAPTSNAVLLSFATSGGSEDRFLFPQYGVLESLSPQHLLISFMVTKKGREAADTTGLDLDKEYWQPVTMMIEVMYGKEEILNCVRKWVKPESEVRQHMQDVMKRCERTPLSYLALRLPFKGAASLPESEEASKETTPAVEEKSKPKAAAATKKRPSLLGKSVMEPTKSTTEAAGSPAVAGAAQTTDVASGAKATSDAAPTETPEGGRPRRTARKSVRISEG